MDTGFQISLFLLRVFSFSLYIIIFMYSLGFAKIGGSLAYLTYSNHRKRPCTGGFEFEIGIESKDQIKRVMENC